MTESQEGWSPYHYVYANPVLRTDPDGRCPDGDCPEVSVAGIVENTVKDLAVSAMNVAFMVEPPMRVLQQGGNTRAYRDENGSIQVGVRPLATNGKEFLGNMGSDLLDGANVASTVATGGTGGGLLMAKTGAKTVIANGLIQKAKSNVSATNPLPDGSFSISDWSGYPNAGNVPQPSGPFRLLDKVEYSSAEKLKNSANKALHKTDPATKGKQIHEIHPVKFGGSPTDPANKIYLDPKTHQKYTGFWNSMMFEIQRKIK